jgi:prevent-host-death family protein
MAIKTVSSREFNQDISSAKRAASSGPVFITDRGKPAHVLLTFEQYQRITSGNRSIVDMLGMSGGLDFEPPKLGSITRPVDLS